MDAVLDAPPASTPKHYTKDPGSRSPQKAIIARALLQRGISQRKAAKESGLSPNTVANIARHEKLKPHSTSGTVEAIKQHWQDEAARKAASARDLITEAKLEAMDGLALTKVAAEWARMAGLGPTPVVEHYVSHLHQFAKASDPKVVNAVVVENQNPANSEIVQSQSGDS